MDQRIRTIFDNHHNDVAVIVGNGINLYTNPNPRNYTWEAMLQALWAELSVTDFPIGNGFSFIEAYDFIRLFSEGDDELQERVKSFVDSIPRTDYHKRLCETLNSLNLPVLTTNFDNLLEETLNQEPYNPLESKRIKGLHFSRFYPWDVYYSDSILSNPLDGFGIWHINGMRKYPMSMRLGLRQYVNQISRVRQFIHDNEADFFEGKNQNDWKGLTTWLHILFNRNLFIFGLKMDVDEIFLRWLLLEREYYFTLFPDRRKEGWFLCRHDEMSEGKQFFLENLGFTIMKFDDYQSLYEGVLI